MSSVETNETTAARPSGQGKSSDPRGLTSVLRLIAWPVLLIIGYLLPTFFGGTNRIYATFVLIAIFAIMSYGLDIIVSYLGEVSLGHTLFWAGGAYTTGILSVNFGWGALPALLASLVFAVIMATILGLATMRTREFVFSLVTYAAAFIGLTVVSNSRYLGGTDGIVGVPLLGLPAIGGRYVADTNAALWPIAFVMLVLVIVFLTRFRRSRLGATALMSHMNPELAIALGVDVRRIRTLVFILSAPVAALAGWLYAFQRSYVSPDLISPYFLLFMLTAVILPGRRVLLGPLIGAAILTVQQQLYSFGGDADKIVLGGLLAAVLLLSPDGLTGLARAMVAKVKGARS